MIDKGIVYIAINKTNGKRYVGQTIQLLKTRKSGTYNPYFTRALKKYEFDWIEVSISVAELDTWERFYVSHYNTMYPNGYNFESGGKRNKKVSNITKEKIRKAHIGKKLTEEHKKKIGLKSAGRVASEETRKKKSEVMRGENNPMYGNYGELNPFYGKTHSAEQRLKISEATKKAMANPKVKAKISGKNSHLYGRKNHLLSELNKIIKTKTYQIIKPDGTEEIITNLSKYCKENNLSNGAMVSVSNGKRNHHKGYKCKKE